MSLKKYSLPHFINKIELCDEEYSKWLHRKANAHFKRDKKREYENISLALYKKLIHQAVCESSGLDYYTGDKLNWALCSKYNNEESKSKRHIYKKSFTLLPTVDHIDVSSMVPKFVICGWQTNDCKSDLSISELVDFCRKIIKKHG